MHQSVATIDSPQFINLQPLDLNPLMSKCDIKVLYVGGNRNRSFITEEVATEIGKTLRGAPIVGYYKKEKEDFGDHGQQVIIDDDGIKFNTLTIPYGFVSPDAKVWFQNFEDTNDFGEKVIRKYLMTTGYLWTGQFAESSLPATEGRPQSMELDRVEGHWDVNKEGMEFFIINDAIISKLCILGDDVEPCFEGASITPPDVSNQFTLDDNFKKTLYSMMKDLKDIIEKGGEQVKDLDKAEFTAEEEVQAPVTEEETVIETEQQEAEVESEQTNNEEASTPETADFKKDNEEEEENKDSESDKKEEEEEESDSDKKEKDKESKDYSLLEEELKVLKENYSTLQAQYQALLEFKKSIDNEKKDELIKEFYMLSDKDKAEIIRDKQKYSLDEIKAKLAVICFDKKVSYTTEQETAKEAQIYTYNINEDATDSNLPDWVKAVKEQEKLG